MDEAYLKRLMDWAAKAPISEIEVVDGDFRVHLVKSGTGSPAAPAAAVSSQDDDLVVTAPLPGVFYLQAAPDAPAFVTVGQAIKVGDTVGLVEAMKMFNPVASELAGTVEEILVKSGEDVAAGQPIVRLRAARSDRE